MMDGEIISTHIKPTENTTIVKLSLFDQLKLLIRRFSNNDLAELEAAERVSRNELRMKASLQKLLNTAVDEMKQRGKNSVTLSVSSRYLPYFDEMLDDVYGMGRYYEFQVFKKELPANIEYRVILKMKRRVS